MSMRNNCVKQTGRTRARDLYDLYRVLDVVLELIEQEDRHVMSQPVKQAGKKRIVRQCVFLDADL